MKAQNSSDHMKPLKQMRIWFHWAWAKDKNGNPTKVPISASGGKTGTNEAYEATWVTYDEAVAALSTHRANGIGFKLPSGYFFLDVDDKDIEHPFVKMLLNRFNSYTERSVSGNGIHIYGMVDFPQIPTYIDEHGKTRLDREFYLKNPHNDVEQYFGDITNRFAVYTGDVICDVPLKDCTQAILTTLDKDMRRNKKKSYSAKRDGDRETFDIIANLRKQKNGNKFIKLFDKGDISDYGGDDSAADCALCSLIAFRTGNDPEMIDAIMRQSALMRDKWNRDDYRERTIEAAVAACNGQFHFSVNPRPYFVEYLPDRDIEVVVPTKLARYFREHQKYIFVKSSAMQGVLKYVYEDGCYRIYSDDMFRGLIKSYIAEYDEDLVRMPIVTEVNAQLSTDLNFVAHDDINADEDLINFQNGLLRLSDMTLLPHSPEVLSTIQIPCDWSGMDTPTPVFDSYIRTLTNGDDEMKQLLLEFGGAVISNVKGYRMKKALFHIGKGNTGKTQLRSLVERLIGRENYTCLDLTELEQRFGTSNIYGKRLAGSADMSFMTVSELKTFKKCTGGDGIFAEFKGVNGFEFNYNGLLWFCMNRLPKFGGDDGKWVYDRIMVVESTNVIPDHQQDKTLLDKMYAEREGIVYKMILALKAVIDNGYRFSEPEIVKEARAEYMEENNTVISFYNECMIARPSGKIEDGCTTGKIFNVYKEWCRDNNHGFAKTAKEFRETLADHLGTTFTDMTVRRGKGGTYYKEFTLADDVKKHYVKAYGYDGSEFLSA